MRFLSEHETDITFLFFWLQVDILCENLSHGTIFCVAYNNIKNIYIKGWRDGLAFTSSSFSVEDLGLIPITYIADHNCP